MTATEENFQRVRQIVSDLPPVVCYHHPCADGVFAALAASNHFSRRGVRSRFFPLCTYKEAYVADVGLSGDEVVYLLDYSGPDGFAQQLAGSCARVVVLDHHKTAAEQFGLQLPGQQQQQQQQDQQQQDQEQQDQELPDNLHVLIDMHRSGAMLALDYFGREGFSEQLLRAFSFVQDADLWAWKLQGSREFHLGLSSLKLEYNAVGNPTVFDQLLLLDVDMVMKKGADELQEQQLQISEAIAQADTLQLGGHLGAGRGWGRALGCVVSGDLVQWRSALGNALAKRSKEMGLEPVAVVAYLEEGMDPSKVKVSLRSIDGWDTTRVTGALGGGGHAAASAVVVAARDFEAWKLPMGVGDVLRLGHADDGGEAQGGEDGGLSPLLTTHLL